MISKKVKNIIKNNKFYIIGKFIPDITDRRAYLYIQFYSYQSDESISTIRATEFSGDLVYAIEIDDEVVAIAHKIDYNPIHWFLQLDCDNNELLERAELVRILLKVWAEKIPKEEEECEEL